jgi:RimJ/RimL family protein N-acetyltransferase
VVQKLPRSLSVRALQAGDPQRLGDLIGAAATDVAAFEAAVGDDPLCGLVAEVNGDPVGAVIGALGQSAYHVLRVATVARSTEATVAALTAHLRAELPGLALEVRTADKTVEGALLRHGFELIRDELGYARSLGSPAADRAPTPFVLRHYDDVGKAAMVDALEGAVHDDSFFRRRRMDALDALDEMIENATRDGQLDASLWYLVECDGDAAGVMLGRRDPGTGEGSFAYIGLAVEFRGRGLGTALHAAGLDLLAAAGVTDYRDATAADNIVMKRVFARNGCVRVGAERVWRLDTREVPSTFDSRDHLIAWLTSDGHAVEIVGEGPWLRLHWRSGYHRRLLELGWLDGAHLTQVMHRFDLRVPDEATGAVARLLGELNAALNVPGFFLDTTTMSAGFRHPVIQNRNGSTSARQLLTTCSLVVNTAEIYAPEIALVCERHRDPPLLRRIPVNPRSAATYHRISDTPTSI